MHYRRWDGMPPTLADDCGIPCCTGVSVVPEVVLVPCLGYTAQGLRLGYGGGYFDRWLALHPGAVAVGVAWAESEIDEHALQKEPHDLALSLIVTEHGVVA
jgi:5-formyltetrahydrofolate cyclo-ligase